MKINLVALAFLLSLPAFTEPVAPAIPMAVATTAGGGSGWSLAGLIISPQAVAIAGGAYVAQWIYFSFFDDFKPGKTNVPERDGNKWHHIFRKKKHGFKRGDSNENMKRAVDLIEKERENGTFTKSGVYELRKIVTKGIVLVVRIMVTAKSIDIGTMFLKNQVCGHTATSYMGAEATA